jgi:hypothetical protein
MVIAVIAVFAVALMLLWNSVLPYLFGLPALNYWQALGLLLISRILFSGIGGGLFERGMAGAHGRGGEHHNSLRERWMNMSEDDRNAFMEKQKDFRTMFHERFSHLHEFYEGRESPNKKEDDHE